MRKILLFVLLVSSVVYSQMPNYFYSTLTATITSTDTTCTINPNDTTAFGSATNFYATIWDTYYSSPSHARSRGGLYETVLIESRSGLTLQIVRARLGSTARNFNVSGRTYRITAEILNDVFDSTGNALDSITAHRTFMNANRDSINAHRTFINANRDSIHKLTDSIAVHRTAINTQISLDSVDIPYYIVFVSDMGAASTFYFPFNTGTANASEGSTKHSPFGVSGSVVAMYVQAITNTLSGGASQLITFTLMTGAADSGGGTTTAVTTTLGAGAKNGSVTGVSVAVTPTMVGAIKVVATGGSGTVTGIAVTLVIRVPRN